MANELQEVLDDIQVDKFQNLKPENIKSGIKVLGVEGTLTGVNNQTKIITENGIYTPDTNLGYTGLGTVEVTIEDPEYTTNLNLTRSILGSYDYPAQILASYDTSFRVGIDKLSVNQKATSGYVLTYSSTGYDSSILLYFDLNTYSFNSAKIDKVYLYAYYFKGDIPSRQQLHPVRKVMKTWAPEIIMNNTYMRDSIEGEMKSLNTSNNGYGWRSCDITYLFKEWLADLSTNYGVIIDNTRGKASGGGLWNKMEYYMSEYGTNYAPKLVLTYKE